MGTGLKFLSFNKARLLAWLHTGRKGARTIWHLANRPERFVASVLVGNNLVNVVYSSLLALYLTDRGVSNEIIFAVTPFVLLLVGEALPKALARQLADYAISPVGIILSIFHWLNIIYLICRFIQTSFNNISVFLFNDLIFFTIS